MAPAGIIRGGNELYVLFAKRRELRHILNRIVDVKPRRKESGKMADWKENKAVGIAAVAVFILAMIFTLKGLIGGRPGQAKLTGAVEEGKVPAEEMLHKR